MDRLFPLAFPRSVDPLSVYISSVSISTLATYCHSNSTAFAPHTNKESFRVEARRQTMSKPFEERVENLLEYESENGHVFVPYAYKGHSNLGYWVTSIRQQYKQGKLASEKVAKLNEIGFAWTSPKGPEKEKAVAWGKQFRWVVEFHKAKGHCNVPGQIGGKDVPAAAWCDEQRQLHLSGKLANDKYEKLSKLGFDFYGSSEVSGDEEPVSTLMISQALHSMSKKSMVGSHHYFALGSCRRRSASASTSRKRTGR